ncbi:MAG: type I 3-dehydroquinate dehydratase [Lentisphaeria bacterium]|nr:type I 3-dehydroquinate dehydratase [Lentisphaeria bacterium]
MIKKSFFNNQRTVIAALLKGTSIEDYIRQCREAEFAGADGIAAELCLLPQEQRTEENFKRLMDEVRLPFMFCLYRNDQSFGKDDAARMDVLLTAARAGAEVIDVMGDLFDPSPRELTRNGDAIARQKEVIGQLHALGTKVIISSHMSCSLRAEEVLEHLQEQASRGADMVKIVTGIHSEEDLLEAIKTTMLLNRELQVPFVHLGTGSHSRIHRYLGMQLGAAVEFAVASHTASPALFAQPTIASFKAVQENLFWHINQ